MNEVDNNYNLCKILARKVYERNKSNGILQEYASVFEEQERLGIIERVDSSLLRLSDCKFIPHRAVVKREALVTTKVRVVYNCSLKVGNKPSLNECSYVGEDLMNGLLDLLMCFRSNLYSVIADIRKAYLNIKLDKEEDKDRFSFIVYDNGRYSHYRFNTILFGFIASPYILHSVIKYHAEFIKKSYSS